MGLFARRAEKKRIKEENAQREAEETKRKVELTESIKSGGEVPTILNVPLALQKNEVCYYEGSGTRLIKREKVTGYTGRSAGVSFRVAKGVTMRTGGGRGQPIRQTVTDRYGGTLYITNKRVIFLADQNGFVLPFTKMISATTYTDGCEYFKENIAYLVTTADTDYCNAIFARAFHESHQ